MTRLHSFVFGLIVGAATVFAGMKFHFVRAEDGLHAIPKVSNQLRGAYVDIRDFTAEDWNDHRDLSLAIVNADKDYLLSDSATDNLRQSVQHALQSLGRLKDSD